MSEFEEGCGKRESCLSGAEPATITILQVPSSGQAAQCPVIDVNVDGIGVLSALVDTGAKVSALTYDCLNLGIDL